MRCETCHGSGRTYRRIQFEAVGEGTIISPIVEEQVEICLDCMGSGVAHCCEPQAMPNEQRLPHAGTFGG